MSRPLRHSLPFSWYRVGSALLLVVFLSTPLSAAEIRGVRFADNLSLGQDEVFLQGMGVLRWMGLVKVYAGALYLPAGVMGPDWADDVAKCLELAYFRKIEAADFGTASDKLLRQTLDEKAYQQLAARLESFYRLFRDVQPGDHYTLIYRPEQGTELRYNGELLGRIAGEDFARAYFGLWLGEKPIDKRFRDRLLGVAGNRESTS